MLISFGNRKLPKTTAIFNMIPARNCPSRKLGLCQLENASKCYALKAEMMYKAVFPYRMRQYTFWKHCTPEEFIKQLFEDKKRKKLTHLRFNEAGDFLSQGCVSKAVKIATLLKKEGITTYCYTARADLNFTNRTPLVVNGSGFMVDNCFEVSKEKSTCVGNCKVCDICTFSKGKTIYVKEH